MADLEQRLERIEALIGTNSDKLVSHLIFDLLEMYKFEL